MFTIRKNGGNRPGRMLLNCFRCIVAVMVFAVVSTPFAQCGIGENGYMFMHPYFEGTAWDATNYVSNVLPDVEMCLDKPVNAAAGKLLGQGTFVYTTADGALWMTNGPLEDSDCPCCRPSILFDSPYEVAVPEGLAFDTALPFCLPGRGGEETDTAYVCIAGTDNRVYSLHVSTATGAVGAVDTIALPDIGTSGLTGVWGEAAAGAIDSEIWIGGTGGLLVRVPVADNGWGTPETFRIDGDETVTAVGGGYVGMASGTLYRRSGDSLVTTGVTAGGALRSIGTQVAVGDNGAVLVSRGGTWEAHISGSDDYRLGNLTANGSGTLVELVDAQWRYTTLQLSDTPTGIEKVSGEAMAGLNQGLYIYGLEKVSDGTRTVVVYLRDADGNRIVPSVQLRIGSASSTMETELTQQTPAAICSTGQAYFADTQVAVILKTDHFEIEARARRGTFDASCRFWNWDYFTYSETMAWTKYDTLLVATADDTLRICNLAESEVTARYPSVDKKKNSSVVVTCAGRKVHLVSGSGSSSEVRRVLVVDAAGRSVWRYARTLPAGAGLHSPQLRSGIHFLRIEYADGTTETRRLVLVGR